MQDPADATETQREAEMLMKAHHYLVIALLLAAASHATRADGPAPEDPHRVPSVAEYVAWDKTFLPKEKDFTAWKATFPWQLRGVWEFAHFGCGDLESESGSRISIDDRFRNGYEERNELAWFRTISVRPLAWLVLAPSTIDPPEAQDPEIYVLEGNNLVITDGTGATTYVRCK